MNGRGDPQRCSFTLEVIPLPDPPLVLLMRLPATPAAPAAATDGSIIDHLPGLPSSLPGRSRTAPVRNRFTPVELSSIHRWDIVIEQGEKAHARLLALDPDRDEPPVDVRLFSTPMNGRVSLDVLENAAGSVGPVELLSPPNWTRDTNSTSNSSSARQQQLLDPASFRWSGVELHYEMTPEQHGTDLMILAFDESSALESKSTPLLVVRIFVLENPCRPNGRCVGEF